MAEHPDFEISSSRYSTQELRIQNSAGDRVRLVCDNSADRALLAGAIETCLVLFEVIDKKGD